MVTCAAELLFVDPNPSIDLNEEFPKFKSEEWPDEKVMDFFSNRLYHVKLDGRKYWGKVFKHAGYILEVTKSFRKINNKEKEIKREIASRIVLTEIAHRKSTSEKEGEVSEAAQKCFKKYTKKVIEYFLETLSGSGKKKPLSS